MNKIQIFAPSRTASGHRLHRFVVLLLALALVLGYSSQCLAATDVYVVFSSKSTALKKTVAAALKETLSVKTYNVDMLALADYSGKQKVIAKFSRAGVSVILGDAPLDALKGSSFGSHLIITSGAGDELASNKMKVYAIPKGASIPGVSQDQVVEVSAATALSGGLKSGYVYVLDSGLSMEDAIKALVTGLLGQQ